MPTSPLSCLVLLSSHLASPQLLQIPPANIHIAPLLIHAVREGLDVIRTWSARLVSICVRICIVHALVAVEVVVHRLSGLSVGVGGLGVLSFFGCRLGGTAAEETAYCVAYGGTHCDATRGMLAMSS